MIKCQKCAHMTVERHEDYMGQPMWYLGKCSKDCPYSNNPSETADCSEFQEGEPMKKDCRSKGDIMFTI